MRARKREECESLLFVDVSMTYLFLPLIRLFFSDRHPETFVRGARDLKRNYIPRVWERVNGMAAARSPKGSAKYDDTHGAATRRYSTSGGRMVDVDLRASQPASQPGSSNESWWLGDRSAIRRQGWRLLSEFWRSWGDLGGFDGEDTRCVGRKNQSAECRTMHEEWHNVCTPEGRRRRKRETRRGMKGKDIEKEDRKGRKKRSWWSERDGTHGSSHHVVYATSYWFSGRGDWRKGAGMVRREKAWDRETGERRWRSVQGGETERRTERRKGTKRPVLRR